MPRPLRPSLLTNISTMRKVSVMILMVWLTMQDVLVCQAADMPPSDPAADSSATGSEAVLSGSGQITSFLHTQPVSPEHMNGFVSHFEVDTGPGTYVPSSGHFEEQPEVTGGGGGHGDDADPSPRAEVSSGDVLAQEELTADSSVTVTLGKRQEKKESVPRMTQKLDDDSVHSSFPPGQTMEPSEPAGLAKGYNDVNYKRNERSSSKAPQHSSSPSGNGKNQEANRTEDNAIFKFNATASEYSRSPKLSGVTPQVQALSSVDAAAKLSMNENQEPGITQVQTTQSQSRPASPGEDSPAKEGTTDRNWLITPHKSLNISAEVNEDVNEGQMLPKPDDLSVPDKDPMISLRPSASLSSARTVTSTLSKEPRDHFTTAEGIFTIQVETSRTAKSAPSLKVTSDQILVSGTRTRRQSNPTSGQTMQHTIPDFSSTVPSNANTTSVMTSTWEPISNASSELANNTSPTSPTTVTMPSTSASTEMLQTSTSASVGMQCQTNQDCAGVNSSHCEQGVCSCLLGYHRNWQNNSCIEEPYGLLAKVSDHDGCVYITWSGSNDQYIVSMTSSVSSDVGRRILTDEKRVEACNFSAGGNLTVSVALSVGGQADTTWAAIKPKEPTNLEISFVNETCFTVEWQPPEGYAELYFLDVDTIFQRYSTVHALTNATEWTLCHLQPGTQFAVKVFSYSHGKNSTKFKYLGPDSTVPSRPTDGWADRNKQYPERCVDLQWTAGPGHRDSFTVTGPLGNTTVNITSSRECRGLLPGSRYKFSIVAYSRPRYSQPLVLEACTDPERVQDFRVERVDATWVTLSWTLTESGRGSQLDRYVIRGNHSEEALVVNGDRSTATVLLLSPGTSYVFSITAEFCNRTSTTSSLIAMTNFSALTSVNVSAEGQVLWVSWELDQEGPTLVELTVRHMELTVYRREVFFSPQTVPTNHSGACYTISLQVVNSSQVLTIVHATEPSAPENVRNLHAHRLTNDRQAINVTWSPPAVTNGIVAFYNVSVWGVRGFQNTSRVKYCEYFCDLDCHDTKTTQAMMLYEEESPTFSLMVEGLSLYENYRVNVTAFTSAGGGPSSSFVVGGQLLDSVRDLTVDSPNASCLYVAWSYPDNAPNHHHNHVHFLVEYQEEKEEEQEDGFKSTEMPDGPVVVFNVSQPQVMLCELRYWTPYRVNVTAADHQGPGITSSVRHRTDEHVPGEVSNVVVSVVSSIYEERRMEVRWSQPVHPNGYVLNYYVLVHDINTSRVIQRQHYTSHHRLQRSVGREGQFQDTFRLIGDHLYIIQIFGATRIGNGSRVEVHRHMPAGVLPPSGDRVKVNSQDVGVTSVLVHVPTSLLCDFGYGLPQHAGYIVHRPGWTPKGVGRGVSVGPTPVLTSPWAPTRTPFYVQMDVRKLCLTATHGGYLSVRLGEEECGASRQRGGGGGGQTSLAGCSGPLEANTGYQLMVVFCTSAACRYSQAAALFTTKPQPEDSDGDSAGLAAGLAVVFLLLMGAGAASYWVWKKKYRRREEPVMPLPLAEREEREAICKSRPVPLERFVEHVQQLHRDSNLEFSEEYKTIKDHSPTYSTRAAELPPCKPKNRYMNILPWDRSRVKLIPTDDEEGSDYINASYLPGENHQREFIAAQGPLPGTVDDFWRMVWENRVCVMVMLTQCIEKGKTKCEKYWPDEGVQTIYGDLVVQVRSQSVLPDYIIRVIDVKLGNQSRMIKHFHFMRWPDHGCPERTSMLLNFVSSVRAHMPHSGAGPTLVHCSAGVGRTGTFIALDRLLLQIRQKSQVDIFNLVFTMREHRIQMVQTENQYVYIHDCLADALTKDKESDDDQSDEEEDEHIYGNC